MSCETIIWICGCVYKCMPGLFSGLFTSACLTTSVVILLNWLGTFKRKQNQIKNEKNTLCCTFSVPSLSLTQHIFPSHCIYSVCFLLPSTPLHTKTPPQGKPTSPCGVRKMLSYYLHAVSSRQAGRGALLSFWNPNPSARWGSVGPTVGVREGMGVWWVVVVVERQRLVNHCVVLCGLHVIV